MAAALHFLAGPAGPGQLCHIILSQPVWHSLIPSWRCSPSRFSAPGLAFQGHMLLSGLCPWQLCRAVSDPLLGPPGLCHLPGLPGGQQSLAGAPLSLTWPRCHCQVSFLQGQWHHLISGLCQALPQTFRAVRKSQ